MKRTLSLVLASAAVSWALTLCAPALAAEDAHDESLVIQRYRKALELDSENANIRYQLGVALLKEKFYGEALENLLAVYEGISGEVEINYYLGIAYAGIGRLDEAYMAYKKAEDIDMEKASHLYGLDKAWYNLGIAYQKKNKAYEALTAYERSIRLSPQDAQAYCRRGEALYELRNYGEALESFRTCEARSPGDAKVKKYIASTRFAKGLSLTGDKKYAEALVEFKKVVELEPKNEKAAYFVGYLHYLNADFKQALSSLAGITSPESPEILENLPALLQNIGVELQAREDWDTAEVAFKRALDLKKDDPDTHYLLGFNCIKKGDYREAVDEIKETMRLNPAHPKANLALAIATEKLIERHLKNGEGHIAKGDYGKAVAEFDEVIEMDPGSKRGIKGKREAERHLEGARLEASRKTEAQIKVKLAQAEQYLKEENYKDALAAFRYIVVLDPYNAAGTQGISAAENFIKEKKDKHSRKGDRYREEGSLYPSLKEYKKALSFDPDDTVILQKATDAEAGLLAEIAPLMEEGAAHEENGNYAEALKAYSEALRRYPESPAAIGARAKAAAALDNNFRMASAKAREFLDAGEYAPAAENFRLAQRLRPDDAGVKEGLARINEAFKKNIAVKLKAADKAVKDGRYAAAVSAYEDALSLDDKNRQAADGLASAKRMLSEENARKKAAAEKEKDRPRKTESKEVEKLYLKGIELYTEGKYVDAIKAWEKVLEADPRHEKAALNIEKAKRKLEGVMDVK